MTQVLDELNKEQLSGLANLSFDLAKLSFAFVLLPAEDKFKNIFLFIISKIAIFFIGLALAYVALIILKLKESSKK